MKEAHRRARRYRNDYGILGVQLLALNAMYVRYGEIRGIEAAGSQAVWNAITALSPQLERSAILPMDRSSGLGLMTDMDGSLVTDSPWRRALTRNGWLCSYLHLLTRPGIVADISRLQSLPDPTSTQYLQSDLASNWCECLPCDRSVISGLRATLSSARPECDDQRFSTFLKYIARYIDVSHKWPFYPHW